ncbi:N-acetyltransferase [Aerophototrophica crusticola]|uniref:N-acetyltransferase n=1 Tax=Aerophototrophica crusticola TaxID=1709002 RepID=A0A858R4Y2_9PROT|nr:N-acetyltransferase [Rhodospirillaceae bacterium B3]
MSAGPDQPQTLSVALVDRVADVPPADWDACAGTANPFVGHTFLRLLEESGSVGEGTGWGPQHLTVRDAAGRLVGCAPLYVKTHSQGEYVFDHGWANALNQAGGRYYPKLQVSVPFTPVPGPRLLTHAQAPAGTRRAMMDALATIARQNRLSSVHATFTTAEEHEEFGEAGWLQRLGTQFHWENRGYTDFDDFLAAFSSRKRKAVRKERREVADSGLEILSLTGPDLKPEHWDAFDKLYRATSDRKWGSPYLTKRFFHLLGEAMPDKVLLVMARDGGRWVGGALNLIGADTLYGRNWGGAGEYPYLHFECCYYRAIEFAIEHGLKRVEAGAQGEHKIQRGYLPVPTYSAHYITHPGLRRAVADFLERETPAMEATIQAYGEESPYRKDGEG